MYLVHATFSFFAVAVTYVLATNKTVYFSLIISGGENGYNSSGGIPSIDIALEAVEREQLLPGYNLTYDTVRNSKVSAMAAYFLIGSCI